MKRLSKSSRKINRPYGGTLTASALRDRIITAFITEEVRDVKATLEKKVAPKKEGGKKTAAQKRPKPAAGPAKKK